MRLLFYVLFLLLPSISVAQYPTPAWVVDEPGKLSSQARLSLVQTLPRIGGATVAVVLLNDLRGETVEAYANGLFRAWALGRREKNDGVLLLISMAEKKIRIEVGYGVEERLTDAKAKRIINEIAPLLRKGDFDRGVLLAVQRIKETL